MTKQPKTIRPQSILTKIHGQRLDELNQLAQGAGASVFIGVLAKGADIAGIGTLTEERPFYMVIPDDVINTEAYDKHGGLIALNKEDALKIIIGVANRNKE